MAEWKTQDGRRPDLEAIEVAPPTGYIGNKLMPVIETTERTGTVYYQSTSGDAIAESAAQTGRSATDAPTEQELAASTTTWTCAEVIDRTLIKPEEAKSYGSMEKADKVGGKVAKRNVMNAIETAIVAKVLGSGVTPTGTFDAAKFILQVQTELNTMRVYSGRRTLYASEIVLKGMARAFLTNSTIGPAFSRLIVGTSPDVAMAGLNLKVLLNAIAMHVGVDECIAGRDSVWNPSGYTGRVGLMLTDDTGDEFSYKYQAVYGKNYLYLPDGKNPFFIESFYDMDDLTNKYTCKANYGLVELNSGMFKVWDGVETA
jgi:hypothetical protein